MIPKTIHYCWFGRNPKPKLAEKCIKSWKKYCPDYEIIEWNEDNFDLSSAPLYVRQAYEAKKWAFVTDYVRLWAMVTYGGIYMDTDVEVIKPLDKFLIHRAFSGFENDTQISTGIMACEKGFPLFVKLLHYYDEVSFLDEEGKPIVTTNVTIITDICSKYGFIPNNQFQIVEGFALYPKDYFCPLDYRTYRLNKTKNTTTIHWFSSSWYDEVQKKKKEERKKQLRIERIVRFPNRVAMKLVGMDNYNKLKKLLGKSVDESN